MKDNIVQFYESFKQVLSERAQKTDFISYYNNDKTRLRDIPKRKTGATILMLGHNSTDAKDGIIAKTVRKINAEYVNFENYRYDCLVYREDDWFDGKRYIEMVIEVESNIKEFKGTVSDLLRMQGASKIGIFYFKLSEDKNKFVIDRSTQLAAVLKYFASNDFIEAEGTDYLLIFLPDRYEGSIDDFINSIFGLNFHIMLDGQKRVDVEETTKTLQTLS